MVDKIKIIHVVGIMNQGGTENMIMNMLRKVDKEIFQFDFVVHGPISGYFEKEIITLGCRIYKCPRYLVLNHLSYVKHWENLLKKIDENSIIHCHIRSTASIILKIAKKNGLKTIAHSHAVNSGGGIKGFVKDNLQKDITKYSDYNLACSKEAGLWLFDNHNFQIFHNSIDINNYEFNKSLRIKKRMALGLSSKDIVLGNVGSNTTIKNQVFLIYLLEKMLAIDINYKLLIVGSGPLLNKLKKLAIKLNIDNNLILTGSRNDVNELYNVMDIFLLPSLYEGLGVVLIESQINGLQCIINETLTREVDLSLGLVSSVTLTLTEWVQQILMCDTNIDERNLLIPNKKIDLYDINKSIEHKQNFYLSVYKGNKKI